MFALVLFLETLETSLIDCVRIGNLNDRKKGAVTEITFGVIKKMAKVINLSEKISQLTSIQASIEVQSEVEKLRLKQLGQEEIEEGSGIYMRSTKKLKIEEQSRPGNWKKLTELALDYYYKDKLKNYVANASTGKRSKLPGIDQGIYDAVLAWAKSFSGQEIKKAAFTRHINNLCKNQRNGNGTIRINPYTINLWKHRRHF